MKEILLFFVSMVILISCDTTFKAEKIITENSNQKTSEIYLVSNLTDTPKTNDSILLNTIVKKRIQEICETNMNIIEFSTYFYFDVYCTRSFFENYEKLKSSESVMDTCDDDDHEYAYPYSYTYERLTGDNNQFYWHLVYPHNMKDTIYCK